MKVYTIPQKMSNTGTWYSMESDKYDRHIKFKKGVNYAVVLADYYGGKGYTTHKTDYSTIKQAMWLKKRNYVYRIIDSNGNVYNVIEGFEHRFLDLAW